MLREGDADERLLTEAELACLAAVLRVGAAVERFLFDIELDAAPTARPVVGLLLRLAIIFPSCDL